MLASTRDARFSTGAPTPLAETAGPYALRCPACEMTMPEDGTRLNCINGCASLLQSVYRERCFRPGPSGELLSRYQAWLPGPAADLRVPLPLVTQLPWLAERLGLPQLWVALSGSWPARDLVFPSDSFKDFEAAAVLARLRRAPGAVIVLASAGNTALAFIAAATATGRACVIFMTEAARAALRVKIPAGPSVRFVTLTGDAQYSDAIALSQKIADGREFVLEGGMKNIGRRDGVGTVIHAAYERIGMLPAAYVQAVGSAAGAVAAIEAARRLINAGCAATVPRLFLAQNAPFAPLVRSWQRGSRVLLADGEATARAQLAHIEASVLSNMQPPYAVAGGIYEALKAGDARMTAVRNAEIEAATREFWQHERIVLDPAAAAALAAARRERDTLARIDGPVLLHLTGAKTLRSALPVRPAFEIRIARSAISDGEALHRLRESLKS